MTYRDMCIFISFLHKKNYILYHSCDIIPAQLMMIRSVVLISEFINIVSHTYTYTHAHGKLLEFLVKLNESGKNFRITLSNNIIFHRCECFPA